MTDLSTSINSIRRRLVLLLVRAFGIVVLLTVCLNLVVMAMQIGRESERNPFFRSPVATILESYYLGHGSWEGVQAVLVENTNPSVRALQPDWQNTILVDGYGRIMLEYGRADTPRVGTLYQPPTGTNGIVLKVAGQPVGTLYVQNSPVPHPWPLVFGLIPSIGLASLLAGLLTLVIGLLLLNRLVGPLAEVIGAAQAVAEGNLAVRVPLHKRHDDLHALSDHFNRMAEALERNDRERRGLFADIAHELRTPLTVLRGRLEGIVDGVYPADDRHIGPALEETYLLERLVEDLRLLTLAESHQLYFEKSEVNLIEIARRSIDMFQPEANEKKIKLNMATNLENAPVFADTQRTEQVISNLLANALHYTPNGGSVCVDIDQFEDEFILCVNDNGPGVPESDLPYIFNRFWRGEKSRSRASGGAGLGLAIVRSLVIEQGGRVEAFNLPAGGLQVCVSMKIARL